MIVIIKEFFDYVNFDGELIGQLITSVLVAGVSLIGLRKDFRSKTKALQRETKTITIIVVALTVISIINVCHSNSESNKKQQKLNNSLTNLTVQNANLRQALNTNSIAQSKLITSSQLQSANELKVAANRLTNLISGSETPPIFKFIAESDSVLVGNVKNMDNLPLYSVSIGVLNFDNFCNCEYKIIKGTIVRSITCYDSNVKDLGVKEVMDNQNSGYDFHLPQFNPKSNMGRFLIDVSIKNKLFKEQAIYFYGKQGLRIIELKDNKIISKKIIVDKLHTYLLSVKEWDKLFPDSLMGELKYFKF